MVVDRYTKGVLTVIAVCLVYQCLLSVGGVVKAEGEGPTGVVLLGWGEMGKNGSPFVTRHEIPVTLQNSRQEPLPVAVQSMPPPQPVTLAYSHERPLPISINGVKNTSGAWDPVNAHIEPQPMGATPGQPRP
jgi:hypothetical protein